MTLQLTKRLIEVDFPIKKISENARKEKSSHNLQIASLHIWWARKPQVSCRAILCAALWPDPVDPSCPRKFFQTASTLMETYFNPMETSEKKYSDPQELRQALFDFIIDFAKIENSNNEQCITIARELTKVASEIDGKSTENLPLVVDPFAGGGSIPFEALRIGANAYASDLNPVAVLLNKILLEYLPKYGDALVEEVLKNGKLIEEEIEKELADCYPKDSQDETPIAYLWARTVKCEGPSCGATIPLMSSKWLANKPKNHTGIGFDLDKENKKISFVLIKDINPKEASEGTVKRSAAICPICGYTTPADSVRKQLNKRRGGTQDSLLYSVVTVKKGLTGRNYRLATDRDLKAIDNAKQKLEILKKNWTEDISLTPDEQTPRNTGHRSVASTVLFGIDRWDDLFTSRQLLTISSFVTKIHAIEEKYPNSDKEFVKAIQICLALSLDKLIQYNSSLCRWKASGEGVVDTFGRQAFAMMMNYAESNIFGGASGNYRTLLLRFTDVLKNNSKFLQGCNGTVQLSSALTNPLPTGIAQAFVTDPPYYDAVAYADLADFFYVWLKRAIHSKNQNIFNFSLSPKEEQVIVWHPHSSQEKSDFEIKMKGALEESRRILSPSGIGVVIFAHKSTSGWEAQLQAMVDAGWIITASWPIDTELDSRMNAMGTASLASSIHLVCRPRVNSDGSLLMDNIGEWSDILSELPIRIHEWMPRLRQENVVGADAIFSCLGPALEIFSRYSRVEKASGEQVFLKDYLEKVWEAVEKEALLMIFEGADASGFEEDSRLTAMWLWTLKGESNGSQKVESSQQDDEEIEIESDAGLPSKTIKITGYTLEYDTARKISQGLGAHLEEMPTLVEIKKGEARILSVAERTSFLFGKQDPTPRKRSRKQEVQLTLFPNEIQPATSDSVNILSDLSDIGKTNLDRVHQSMILFGNGYSEGLKKFLVEDGIGKDPQFWKLAQALSALYPSGSDEKRWVEGVLARKKGLGL